MNREAYVVKLHLLYVPVFLALVLPLAYGQQEGDSYVLHPNQEVRIEDLSAVKAQSTGGAAVLLAAVETVLHNQDLCCEQDSALADSVISADPLSLKDLSVKLQGRHLLSDGRPIIASAEYLPPSSINPDQIIKSLRDKHAILMQWNSHVYVLYGTTFDETRYNSGLRMYAIRKLLLLDPRFSDERREVSFNRETDDWGKVQGMLMLTVTLP